MSRRRYDMIAIDLDGTLLDPQGRITGRCREAVIEARRDGALVTVCTGRGLAECRHYAVEIEQADPVVVAGGAILACPVSSRTLHRFHMDRTLVDRVVGCLTGHGHAALVLKDPSESGYDYLVVGERMEAGIDPVTRWWFELLGVSVRYAVSLEEDEHPGSTVRVGVCGSLRETRAAAAEVRECFGNETMLHHFGAVVPGRDTHDPEDEVRILEVFDPRAHKWSSVEVLAGQRGIDRERIAAIGNDVNDITMLRNAGLGIAMGNSIPEAIEASARVTGSNVEDGVAQAIERILSGDW